MASDNIEHVSDLYYRFFKQTKDAQASALLTLAHVIFDRPRQLEFGVSLGHEVCMGIRHGLFGGDGNLGGLDSIASALTDIASALDKGEE
jgi:hypothetical protein